jgi:hypothetical protein
MMILAKDYEIFKFLNKEEFKLLAIGFLAVIRLEIRAISSDNIVSQSYPEKKEAEKKFKIKVVGL